MREGTGSRMGMQTGASCAWSFARAAFLVWCVLSILGVRLSSPADGKVTYAILIGVVGCLPLFFAAHGAPT